MTSKVTIFLVTALYLSTDRNSHSSSRQVFCQSCKTQYRLKIHVHGHSGHRVTFILNSGPESSSWCHSMPWAPFQKFFRNISAHFSFLAPVCQNKQKTLYAFMNQIYTFWLPRNDLNEYSFKEQKCWSSHKDCLKRKSAGRCITSEVFMLVTAHWPWKCNYFVFPQILTVLYPRSFQFCLLHPTTRAGETKECAVSKIMKIPVRKGRKWKEYERTLIC